MEQQSMSVHKSELRAGCYYLVTLKENLKSTVLRWSQSKELWTSSNGKSYHPNQILTVERKVA